MRVLSCWRVLWFMAWMISCICRCDSGAVLICWRRSSALWPAGGREGAQGCPDGWQIVPCPTLCHFGKRVQFVAKSSVRSDSAPPADHSKEEFTHHNRLREDLQHLAAHVEASAESRVCSAPSQSQPVCFQSSWCWHPEENFCWWSVWESKNCDH